MSHLATSEISGALLIDKPAGLSSARIVGILKRKTGGVKTGHAGTLDPMATGLLVALFGKATRLQRLFLHARKSYEGTIRLGVATDTDDSTGTVVRRDSEQRYLERGRETVLNELKAAFCGELQQRPPSFSAVKQNGLRSYRAARGGELLILPSRTIIVDRLELSFLADDLLYYSVDCSKGTYIRALARDIGEFLQSCASLESIRRTRSGSFHVVDSIPLKVIEDDAAIISEHVIPLEQLAAQLPTSEVSDDCANRLRHGQQEILGSLEFSAANVGETAFGGIRTGDGTLVAVVERETADAPWRLSFVI